MEPTAAQWHIVVGIDGSTQAEHALAWAGAEAGIRGAALHVVHAWSPPVPVSEIAAMVGPEDSEPYRIAAERLVEDATSRVDAALPVHSRAVLGYPSNVLLEASAGADLLVVGSRGRGGFAGLVLGSVSQQVVHHAGRPVAVVRASAPLPDSADVVVGVDGSEGSWAALRWAVDEAGVRGARLSVVHGWWTPYAVPPAGIGVPPLDPQDFLSASETLLHRMVDGTVARAPQPPASVELLPVEEPAAPALLQRSKGAGLLVVGARGRGGFAGLLLGSTSQQCLHHATCAVVVVPHRG